MFDAFFMTFSLTISVVVFGVKSCGCTVTLTKLYIQSKGIVNFFCPGHPMAFGPALQKYYYRIKLFSRKITLNLLT